MIVERCLGGISLLGENDLNSLCDSLVLKLLQKAPERNETEGLVVLMPMIRALLPSCVSAHNDCPNSRCNAASDNQLGGMMEVVFEPEVTLLQAPLAGALVVPLVDTLDNPAIDQYWTILVESYRCQVVHSKVNGTNPGLVSLIAPSPLLLGFWGFFILNLNHETKRLGRNNHLLVRLVGLDTETTVSGFKPLTRAAGTPPLDGLVVENNLSQLLFVAWRLRTNKELFRVILEGAQRLLKVDPVSPDASNRLLGNLSVPEASEAIKLFYLMDQNIDIRQLTRRVCAPREPRLPDQIVAPVVQPPRQIAQPNNVRVSRMKMSLCKHGFYFGALPQKSFLFPKDFSETNGTVEDLLAKC